MKFGMEKHPDLQRKSLVIGNYRHIGHVTNNGPQLGKDRDPDSSSGAPYFVASKQIRRRTMYLTNNLFIFMFLLFINDIEVGCISDTFFYQSTTK